MHDFFCQKVNIYQMPTPCRPRFVMREATIGDLHANIIKLLYFLIRHHIIDMDNRVYDRIVTLYNINWADWDKKHISELHGLLLRFKVVNPNVLVKLIGDEVADRGALCILILWFLEAFVNRGGLIQIHVSNHGFDFITFMELHHHSLRGQPSHEHLYALYTRHNNLYSRSLANLDFALTKGWVTWSDLKLLYVDIYRPLLRVMTHSLCPIKKEYHLFSHAESGLETIHSLNDCFRVLHGTDTVTGITESIELMNYRFQKEYAQKNTIVVNGLNHHLGYRSGLTAQTAVAYLVWYRAGEDTLNPPNTPHTLHFDESARPEPVKLGWFHGHDPYSNQTGVSFSLDCPSGKSIFSGAPYPEEPYTDLVSDHLPLTMVLYSSAMQPVIGEMVDSMPEHRDALLSLFENLWNLTFSFIVTTTILDPYRKKRFEASKRALVDQISLLEHDRVDGKNQTFIERILPILDAPVKEIYQRNENVPNCPISPSVSNQQLFFLAPTASSDSSAATVWNME